MPEIAKHIRAVALELLGEPNEALSSPREWRFGSHGSVSIDLEKGIWYDHEKDEGGGVLHLIARETGSTNGAAIEWLLSRGFDVGPDHAFTTNGVRAESHVVATYPYQDASGALLFEVVRYEPKDFRQRRPDPSAHDGWAWNLKGTRRVPYRLPEILEAPEGAIILVVEGEKDADRLAKLGLLATTSPQGAGKWRDEYAEMMREVRVVAIPDNDEPGEKHAAAVVASFRQRGTPAAVLRLEDLPVKGDVSDWLDAGGTPDKLLKLAEAALEAAQNPMEPKRLDPTPFLLPDPAAVPPRQWLYDDRLISGHLALTVAPGGLAKTSLVIAEALAMTTGRPLLGAQPPRPLRVWFWNGEDPAEETERRIVAACAHYGITATDLGGRLFCDSGRDQPICLATEQSGGTVVARPLGDEMVNALGRRKIDVLIVDPFVTTHTVAENSNTGINAVASLWREIADRAGCAVELVHHAQKAARLHGDELGIAQSRGASALIDAARSTRFLVGMKPEEAERAGLETHLGTFRVETGKANLAPPSAKATWRRIASVALGNGNDLYPEGDHVGVVTPWEWPDPFDGVDVVTLDAVKAAVRAGMWKASEQAQEWVGYAVADVLDLEIGQFKKADRTRQQTADRARVRGLVSTWIRNGELIEVRRTDHANRREAPFVEVPS